MSRAVVVLDVGKGQEALLFVSESAARTWLGRHPEFERFVLGVVPLTVQGEVWRSVLAMVDGGSLGGSTNDPDLTHGK